MKQRDSNGAVSKLRHACFCHAPFSLTTSATYQQLIIGTIHKMIQLRAVLEICPLCPRIFPVTLQQPVVGNGKFDNFETDFEPSIMCVKLDLMLHKAPLAKLPALPHQVFFFEHVFQAEILCCPYLVTMLE